MSQTDLSQFDNSWYRPGSFVRRFLWYFTDHIFFRTSFPITRIKVSLLRLFGANVGKGVVIKPHVSIKYPWKLSIGDYSWIGEQVWIDNLAFVGIGKHACISQGAMLLCGNHNYKRTGFDLIVKEIHIEDGAWVGAKSVVCPGVRMGSHSILAVGSIAVHSLEPYYIYQGNPAVKVKERVFES